MMFRFKEQFSSEDIAQKYNIKGKNRLLLLEILLGKGKYFKKDISVIYPDKTRMKQTIFLFKHLGIVKESYDLFFIPSEFVDNNLEFLEYVQND